MTFYRLYTTLQWVNTSGKTWGFASVGTELGREIQLEYTNGLGTRGPKECPKL